MGHCGIRWANWAWFLGSLALLFFLGYSEAAWAIDDGCAGIVAGVFPLGGEEAVVPVETIRETRLHDLHFHHPTETVQFQLRQHGRFGFVAVRDEKIVGYIVAERRDAYVEIVSMAVAVGMERHGVGRELMEQLFKEARHKPGVWAVQIVVAITETDFRQFLSREQFTEVEPRFRAFEEGKLPGVLCRRVVNPAEREDSLEALLAPQRQTQREPKAVGVQVIEASREFLFEVDPVLAASRRAAESN